MKTIEYSEKPSSVEFGIWDKVSSHPQNIIGSLTLFGLIGQVTVDSDFLGS